MIFARILVNEGFCLLTVDTSGSAPTLKGKPEIKVNEKERKATFLVKVACPGGPPSTIRWFYKDQLLLNEGRYSIQVNTLADDHELSLIVSQVCLL